MVQPNTQYPVQQPNVAPAPYPLPGQQAYGAPANIGSVPPMPPAEIKWSGLETGGSFHLPVLGFIGRMTEIVEDLQNQYGVRIIEKYDQVQILNSPVPWPWATIEPSIKYSGKENSAWGKHIASAKALGLAVNATTLAEAKADLVGKMYEMVQVSESYGEDRTTGQTMKGDVWRFVRIVQPGAPAVLPQPQYATPAPATILTPVQQVTPASVPAATPVPIPEPPATQPVVAPVPLEPTSVAPAGTFDVTPKPDDTASVRAKKLLQGRALNEWLGVALVDDVIKVDQAFINTIYDQSFIVGLKGSNQVSLGADGKFTVLS